MWDVSDAVVGATDAKLDADAMVLHVAGVQVDVRSMLHLGNALDRVTSFVSDDGTKLSLPVRGGRYMGVYRQTGVYIGGFRGHSMCAETTPVAAARGRALALRKRKRTPEDAPQDAPQDAPPPQDDDEVIFSHEVTREERDAIGRANAVGVD